MNCESRQLLTALVVILAVGGCRPSDYEPSNPAEAEEIYSQTKWFFAPRLAFSKRVPDPDPEVPSDSRNQTFFKLASGTYIIYSEYLPSSGIKAFRGSGRLETLPGLAGPVYRLSNNYTAEHPDSVMVVGFCGERRFLVQARGTNQQTVLADAVSLATNALVSLRNQARNP
jgi:hypothetical protein